MARRPPLPTPSALRRRREHRTQRLLANRAVADALVSTAGLVGRPVRDRTGAEVGRVIDVVVRWRGEPYPPVTGLVVRVGRRRAFVPIDHVQEISTERVTLSSVRLDLRDFERRPGEVVLNGDVVDHQLVDVDGVRVIRAADLYLARVGEVYELVGVDVGFQTLLRRLGPPRWRRRPTPDRVIDWAAIQPFGTGGPGGAGTGPPGLMRLHTPNQALRRLRPAELADLLEELGRDERQELLAQLETETAADALEEMEAGEILALLRESSTEDAAKLLAEMEPDEAVDALRDLERDETDELLAAMPPEKAARLQALLLYREGSAGGLMTTNLVLVRPEQKVGQVRRILRSQAEHQADVDGVIIVDETGRLVHDLGLFELLVASKDDAVIDVAGPPEPVTVSPEAPLDDVVRVFIDSRGSSVLVIDDDDRPVGRILADDLIDALVPDRGKVRLLRLRG
ncbi:MAG TPA: CBS domain-containing protein [Acidimicrobiia bacterium]|jgi:CBS domain-containing protein/sporulation protein YlmC with PRC-barrel domain